MIVTREALDEVLSRASYLTGDDRDFFLRVWATDPDIYRERIRAAGFEALGDILDAGCGFGQWTLALAETNRSVAAIDVSDVRVRIVSDLAAHFGVSNLNTAQSSVEQTAYGDEAFDGIFSYSVIYFTDFRKSIAEFARLLRPGGRLYLCTNGLGWYLHNFANAHNASATFDPRTMAIATLENSLDFYASGKRTPGRQLVTPSEVILAELRKNGFEILAVGPEGTLAGPGQSPGRSFYQGEYFGAEGVYDVVARKGA
jgi:2-polyprenyl-3-methyl-5-hydroxy-6-metoxy-1,4-benzoquinol methylase